MNDRSAVRPSLWVDIDVAALRHNLLQVRASIADGVRLMAVVKANAYGHGLVEASRAFLEAGADALAVTRLEEAEALRSAGIGAPLLVFDSLQPDCVSEAVRLDVQPTVCDKRLVDALAEHSRLAHRAISVHLKIDTGMGRIGAGPEDATELAVYLAESGLTLAGVYTHFYSAYERDLKATAEQMDLFHGVLRSLRQVGIDPTQTHAANSAAILRLPASHFSMVRPGTVLYGQYPSEHVPRDLDLRNTWSLKSRVSIVKTLRAGQTVGYGAEFRARRDTKVAVVPAGWADGLTLIPESLARRSLLRLGSASLTGDPVLSMTLRGKKAPVVGRIAMQMCTLDVTHVPGVEAGDEVVIPSRRITTSALVPRVYSDD